MKTEDIKDFQAGEWVERHEYKSFTPSSINKQWTSNNPEIIALLSEAEFQIGRLNAYSELVPEMSSFVNMFVTKDAVASCRIEGAQVSFEEALMKERETPEKRREDWREVHYYIDTLYKAIEEKKRLPISNRLISSIHEMILQGARGKKQQPGAYRTSQNWIGENLKKAIFVPPTSEEIPELMKDLEDFIHTETMDMSLQTPYLIKAAIIHYQFATIHPFLIGNNRLGNILTTLYLIDKGRLKLPVLPLSDYFELNSRQYFATFMQVRTFNELEKWIAFFLKAIIETSKKGIQALQNIIALQDDIVSKRFIYLERKQPIGRRLLSELYKQPMIDSNQIVDLLEVHPATANRLLVDFEEMHILRELTGYRRNRIFSFDEYIRQF